PHLIRMIDELYSREILRRTTMLLHVGHLKNPQGVADKVAKLCGSTIHVEVNVEGDVVTDFAQQVKACALGQASAAILSQHVIGASINEITEARDALRHLLKGETAIFPECFDDLKILAAVRDFPARHASTLLAFEATVAAISSRSLS
ncbi:MAG: iron-sulfur cluster assembly scaffold protein, partial [Asticcacaulis sp.]